MINKADLVEGGKIEEKLKESGELKTLEEFLREEKQQSQDEIMYYIKEYGTTDELVDYYITNNKLDEIVEVASSDNNLISNFTQKVLNKCNQKGISIDFCIRLNALRDKMPVSNKLMELMTEFFKERQDTYNLVQLYQINKQYIKAAREALNAARIMMEIEKKNLFWKLAEKSLYEFGESIGETEAVDCEFKGKVDSSFVNRS